MNEKKNEHNLRCGLFKEKPEKVIKVIFSSKQNYYAKFFREDFFFVNEYNFAVKL